MRPRGLLRRSRLPARPHDRVALIGARGAPVALVASGVAAVGVAFGLARYGYGLLLPELRTAFELDSAALGAIGAGAYAAYLAATFAAAWLVLRIGARATILVG